MTNKDKFFDYLVSLDLFRWHIVETPSAFEATLSIESKPNLSDFTQVSQNEDGTWWVRLAKVDVHNEAITKGFFNQPDAELKLYEAAPVISYYEIDQWFPLT